MANYTEHELETYQKIQEELDEMHDYTFHGTKGVYSIYLSKDNGGEHCRFTLHSSRRPMKMFVAEGDTFSEAVDTLRKKYIDL